MKWVPYLIVCVSVQVHPGVAAESSAVRKAHRDLDRINRSVIQQIGKVEDLLKHEFECEVGSRKGEQCSPSTTSCGAYLKLFAVVDERLQLMEQRIVKDKRMRAKERDSMLAKHKGIVEEGLKMREKFLAGKCTTV